MSALKDFMNDRNRAEREKRELAARSSDDTILSAIDMIAETSSTNEKTELVRELMRIPKGLFVLKTTYDPYMTFGIRPDRAWIVSGDTDKTSEQTIVDANATLTKLARRELTGNAAIEAIKSHFAHMGKPSQELLYRILDRDLRAGFGETILRKVDSDIYPRFDVMLAKPFEAKRVTSWPTRVEFKLDGYRVIFRCKDDVGAFYTRSGQRIEALDFMVKSTVETIKMAIRHAHVDVENLSGVVEDQVLVSQHMHRSKAKTGESRSLDIVLDGEVIMGLFEDMGALRKTGVDAVGAEFHVYDILPLAVFEGQAPAVPSLAERRKLLNRLFERFDMLDPTATTAQEHLKVARGFLFKIPQYFAPDESAVQDLFGMARSMTLARYLARGNETREEELLKTTIDKATGQPKVMEGIMVKDPEAPYAFKRSFGWMKIKGCEAGDFPIIGAFPGTPGTKYENQLGGFVVDVNGVLVRVGSGFSDADRERFGIEFNRDMTDAGVVNFVKKDDAWIFTGTTWPPLMRVLGVMAEVEYHEVTPDGSLRHPRMIRLRHDKIA